MDVISVVVGFGKLGNVAVNVVSGVGVIIGVVFLIQALMDFWLISGGSQHMVSSKRQPSVASGLVGLVVAGLLISMGSQTIMHLMSSTFIGQSVHVIAPDSISYDPDSSTTVETQKAVWESVLAIMQIIGAVAVVKSLMIFRALSDGTAKHSQGEAWTYFIAGGMLWHFNGWASIIFKLFGLGG